MGHSRMIALIDAIFLFLRRMTYVKETFIFRPITIKCGRN